MCCPGFVDTFNASGIAPIVLQPGYVTMNSYLSLWDIALSICEDDLLPVRISKQTHISDYGLLGSILMHSRTLNDGLKNTVQYERIITDCMFTTADIKGRSCIVQVHQVSLLSLDRYWPVFFKVIADFVTLSAFLTQRNIRVEDGVFTELSIQTVLGEKKKIFEQYFGCAIHEGSSINSFSVPISFLSQSVYNPDTQLLNYFKYVADEAIIKTQHQVITAKVYSAIASTLRPVDARVSQVAEALGISESSLKGNLANEGTTFSEIKDSYLLSETKRLVGAHNCSQSQISSCLGYSNPSAFSKAFKRWTGLKFDEFFATQL